MNIEVRLFAQLRKYLPRSSQGGTRIDMPEGATIADALAAFGGQQIPAGPGDHPGGVVEVAEEGVEDVAQAGRRVADAVRELQPAFGSFDRGGTQAVLDFHDRVVLAVVDDLLLADGRVQGRGGGRAVDRSAADRPGPGGSRRR